MTLKTRLVALVAGALAISLAAGGILIAAAASHWVQAEIDADAQMARQLVEARVAEEAEEAESPGTICMPGIWRTAPRHRRRPRMTFPSRAPRRRGWRRSWGCGRASRKFRFQPPETAPGRSC